MSALAFNAVNKFMKPNRLAHLHYFTAKRPLDETDIDLIDKNSPIKWKYVCINGYRLAVTICDNTSPAT